LFISPFVLRTVTLQMSRSPCFAPVRLERFAVAREAASA